MDDSDGTEQSNTSQGSLILLDNSGDLSRIAKALEDIAGELRMIRLSQFEGYDRGLGPT